MSNTLPPMVGGNPDAKGLASSIGIVWKGTQLPLKTDPADILIFDLWAADELRCRQGLDLAAGLPFGAIVLPFEGDALVGAGDQAAVGDGDARRRHGLGREPYDAPVSKTRYRSSIPPLLNRPRNRLAKSGARTFPSASIYVESRNYDPG